MPREAFEIHTPYGRIKDRLEKLWKEKKGEEPEVDRIANVLEETASENEREWLSKARNLLGL
jgi:hypothetical protein